MSGTNGSVEGLPGTRHTHQQVDPEKANTQSLMQRITALEDRMSTGGSSSVNARESFMPHSARIANTGPLGLFAFGYTTALLSATYTRWTDPTVEGTTEFAQSYALFFGGLIQLLAGMWAIWANNTFAGTAFSSYGGFWMGYGIYGILVASGIFTGSQIEGEETFLALWAVFTFCLFLQTFNINVALMLLFFFLTMTFALLSAGLQHPRVLKAGGYFGEAAAFMAFYTALAELTNEVYRRKIIPLGVLNIVTAQPDYSAPRPDTL